MFASVDSYFDRVRLFNDFFNSSDSKYFYEELFNKLPWKQRSDVKNGESYLQPRLTAWYGDHGYKYSGVIHKADPNVRSQRDSLYVLFILTIMALVCRL